MTRADLEALAGITRNPSVMNGQYCLAGTRMPVAQIKRMVSDVGREWVVREFPWITDAQIDTALSFRAHAKEASNG